MSTYNKTKDDCSEITEFKNMLGLTMRSVVRKTEECEDELIFTAENGRQFIFYYEPDCCANCNIEDMCGDLTDLQGSPLLVAEEVSNYHETAPPPQKDYVDSYTWTFYKFATAKGSVTVRWLGESNGYYSESVSYRETSAPEAESE